MAEVLYGIIVGATLGSALTVWLSMRVHATLWDKGYDLGVSHGREQERLIQNIAELRRWPVANGTPPLRVLPDPGGSNG